MNADPRLGTLLGDYRIEQLIGRGGMGIVYRAEQLGLGRQVALKVISPELAQDPDFRERFKRESRLAAGIDHPNVIPIHEAGEADGLLYISMRYVEGTDLRALIRREGRLRPDRAAAIVGEVAGALDAAHARGLVHRDVKPANVLIAGSPPAEHAYLSDFGLVKQVGVSGGITGTGQWVGTLDYVSPEQIEGRRVDARADVYALGCVLHQALTGSVPFPRDSDVAKMYAHLNEPPPSCCASVPGIPDPLDHVVQRAMAKDPDQRFPSAGDLARAAGAAAQGTQVQAPERSVAAGAAAPGGGPTAPAAPPPPPPAPPPRWEQRPSATPPTAHLPPPAAAPPARRGPGAALLAALLVLLALGGAAAALVATGTLSGDEEGGSSSDTQSDQKDRDDDTDKEPDRDKTPADTATYTSEAYRAEYPKGWEVAIDDQLQTNFHRTEFRSADGQFVIVDRSPGKGGVDPADSAAEVERGTRGSAGYERISFDETTIAGQPAFEWTFEIDTETGHERRVDLFLNLGDDGYAVYGGGSSDFDSVLTRTRAVAESLEPL